MSLQGVIFSLAILALIFFPSCSPLAIRPPFITNPEPNNPSPTANPNHPPVIEELIFTPENSGYFSQKPEGNKIYKGEKCEIKCLASDPDDGDELSYEWTLSAGTISVEASVATWTAPIEKIESLQGGKATVTVKVSDGNGGVASKDVVFTVVTCTCSL